MRPGSADRFLAPYLRRPLRCPAYGRQCQRDRIGRIQTSPYPASEGHSPSGITATWPSEPDEGVPSVSDRSQLFLIKGEGRGDDFVTAKWQVTMLSTRYTTIAEASMS